MKINNFLRAKVGPAFAPVVLALTIGTASAQDEAARELPQVEQQREESARPLELAGAGLMGLVALIAFGRASGGGSSFKYPGTIPPRSPVPPVGRGPINPTSPVPPGYYGSKGPSLQ